MLDNKRKEILVFDFDGTILRIDCFKMIILLRCLNPVTWKTLLKSLNIYFREEGTYLRKVLYKNLWYSKSHRTSWICKFFKNKMFDIFIRRRCLDLLRHSTKIKHVLILSANEEEIIKEFIKQFCDKEEQYIDVIATNSLQDEDPIKGSRKVKKYLEYLTKQKLNKEYAIMHSFFDSRSDFELAQLSDVPVSFNWLHEIIGLSKKYGFITFNNYVEHKKTI